MILRKAASAAKGKGEHFGNGSNALGEKDVIYRRI